MFKCQEDQLEVLGVCIDEPRRMGRFEGMGFHQATSGRRAVDLLRMLSFDFLLVGTRLPDMSTWDFLRFLRTAHPHQKWALVGGPLTEQQEITARMFGATTIFDTTPTTHELMNTTSRLRERAIASVLSGRFDRSAYSVARPSIAL
jgi:DNA-binding response OmpR family regulator